MDPMGSAQKAVDSAQTVIMRRSPRGGAAAATLASGGAAQFAAAFFPPPVGMPTPFLGTPSTGEHISNPVSLELSLLCISMQITSVVCASGIVCSEAPDAKPFGDNEVFWNARALYIRTRGLEVAVERMTGRKMRYAKLSLAAGVAFVPTASASG